jgi:hypothetical protein
MSKQSFTPGPWITFAEIDCDGDELIGVKPRNGGDVADCSINKHRPYDVRVANARLMAAAPDLLEACKLARYVCEDGMALQKLVDAAIAKATGEQQ